MMKTLNFISKHKIVVIFVFISIMIMVLGSGLSRNKQELPKAGATYKSLSPGISTKNEVNERLGNPISENPQGQLIITDYASNSETRPNQVVYDNQVVQFIKEIISYKDSKTVDDIKKEYGEAEIVLYGHGSVSNYNLYAYPNKGVAYIGNDYTSDLLEVWYFQPTTIEEFRSTWAPEYSTTPKAFQKY